MYDDISQNDKVQIFSETLVRYKGELKFVKTITEEGKLALYPIEEKGKAIAVSLSDPNLDFSQLFLGFINTDKDAFFLERLPSRQYKHGICKNNIKVHACGRLWDATAHSKVKAVRSRYIEDTRRIKYPSLDEAILRISNGCNSVAFSREFAIDYDHNLFFKTERVGVVDVDKREIVMIKSRHYLKDVLYAGK